MLLTGLSRGFCAGGIDESSESSDSGRDGQSFCNLLASELAGIVHSLVSAGPAFFLGLPMAKRRLDNDRLSEVCRSGISF